jgi:hypothetical protein
MLSTKATVPRAGPLEDADVVVDAILLILSDTFGNPCDVADFLACRVSYISGLRSYIVGRGKSLPAP